MGFGTVLLYAVSFFGLYTAVFFLITLLENSELKRAKAEHSNLGKVSIIVPAFNEEKIVHKTVKSLLGLDYPKDKLQIIVVDDKSTDSTLEVARRFKKYGVEVYAKDANEGKASALNFGLKRATGDFVGCLDADSYVEPDALRKIMSYFYKPDVMAVTPSLKCAPPKNWLQKIQVIEFMLGVFLRKVFACIGSIHVTPGPFTIYRKEFFEKYGPYDTTTQTEDIEIALRIQSNNYVIENAADASVYSVAKPTFRGALNQRLRWYNGFLENVLKYRYMLFSTKYGNLGVLVLPSAFLAVIFAITVITYSLATLASQLYQDLINFYNIGFDISKILDFNFDLFFIDSSALTILGLLGISSAIMMIIISKRLSNEKLKLRYCYPLFIVMYLPLFSFWWLATIYCRITGKKIGWAGKTRDKEEICMS